MIALGTRLFGRSDVIEKGAIFTMFHHFCFMPVWPVDTYFVGADGTSRLMPMSWKSILSAYLVSPLVFLTVSPLMLAASLPFVAPEDMASQVVVQMAAACLVPAVAFGSMLALVLGLSARCSAARAQEIERQIGSMPTHELRRQGLLTFS